MALEREGRKESEGHFIKLFKGNFLLVLFLYDIYGVALESERGEEGIRGPLYQTI
jgi:hypothetical protein